MGHSGTYYAYCDLNGTTQTNWRETQVDTLSWYQACLSFNASGLPRAALMFSPTSKFYLAYVQCDSNCGVGPNWHGTTLYDLGSGESFALALTSNDQLRLVI